ncbi:MAG TPA: 2Fe-2S iron-sulfur cluster-binding protein, partial [Solirubrobacteraceae bacterium]
MSEFQLRLRRYDPESGDAPYWAEYTVNLEGHRSVLEGILQAKGEIDGSIGIRCSCRAAICGSCGVLINGQTGLACHTHLDKAARHAKDGVIEVEPMANMPVIKDLIVDMDAVHWKKIQRVTPWLLPDGPPPEREYIVPKESMVDVTQTMACIQCGACVSDCLSMEVDPDFIGPAALAKAYRFVGDPRDGQQFERLKDLIVDMDAVHWKKIQRVTPWLLPDGDAPEREYIVPPESMIDVTQTMACIQCGASVSDCLSMEVDPLFIGPAALAKAYRFVGDPRDGQQFERLKDLAEDPHGIYDCTHCFNCIEACPKGVAPMSQIMRLRRMAGSDYGI